VRQLLRKVLADRIELRPEERADGPGISFTAEATFVKLFDSWPGAVSMASPAGFDQGHTDTLAGWFALGPLRSAAARASEPALN
jgi:hypothetical protein